MINNRLVWFLEQNHLLSSTQCGFRRLRSTTDHLVRMESSIREAFVNREHLVSVFFDLEKAYDTTWRYGVLRDLHRFGLRGNLPIFVSNFLSARNFQVRLGNTLSRTYVQEEGVPQGSVLSVTLFSIKINDITKQLPPSVANSLFVDDFNISRRSADMRVIQRQLQLTLDRIHLWAQRNGFRFSPEKTKVLHFCWRKGPHPDPELRLGGVVLPVVGETRFLGLVFDTKLNFHSHVRQLRAKCLRAMNVLKVLSHTTWGADRASLLRLYRALVRSKLDYGAVVYGSARPSVLARLDPVHHQALRLCTGAFRTSPVQSLYVESHEPPLRLRRAQLSLCYAAKLRSLPDNPAWQCVFELRFETLFQHRPSILPPFNIRLKGLLREFNISFDGIAQSDAAGLPPWEAGPPPVDLSLASSAKSCTSDWAYLEMFAAHRALYPEHQAVFTDGSKSPSSVGSAMVCGTSTAADGIPTEASVFTAELHAIELALEHIAAGGHDRCVIYSDSLSSLQVLVHAKHLPNPVLSRVRKKLCELAHTGFQLLFCWIPGHVGIKGNELADLAARSAASSPGDRFLVPFTDLKPVIRASLHSHWQASWSEQTANKLFQIKPLVEPWASSRQQDRSEEVVLCCIRIGHSRLTHTFLLLREDPPLCECGEDLTISHVLLACRLFTAARSRYFNTPFSLPSVLGDFNTSLSRLFSFLRATGLFNKI